MIYPQPAQIQQRVLLPEPPITTDLQMLNQVVMRNLNETKTIRDEMETSRRIDELKAENRELVRQQNQTQMIAQLLQRQPQPTNQPPPTIILNVTPASSRASSSLSRQVQSALTKVYSIANGQSGHHRSNEPGRFETAPVRRAITSFEDPNKLEDITDDDELIQSETEEAAAERLEENAFQPDSDEWAAGNQQNEESAKRGQKNLELDDSGNQMERTDSEQNVEEGRRSGEPFSMWKSRELGLGNGTSIDVKRVEIPSISGQLFEKRDRSNLDGEKRSVSIDVHCDTGNGNSGNRTFLSEQDSSDANSDQVEGNLRRNVGRSRSFVTPDFGRHKSVEEEPYKPYFKDVVAVHK